MGTAREIRKHQMLAHGLTGLEAVVLVAAVGQVARNPLGILLNPPKGLLRNLFSARTVMLWVATYLYLVSKIAQADRRARMAVLLRYFVSQMIFLQYFACLSPNACMNDRLAALLPVNPYSAYNMVLCASSAVLLAYAEEVLWTKARYTQVRGLVNYMRKSMGAVVADMLCLYMASTGMAIACMGVYLTISRTLFPWMRFIVPFRQAHGRPWGGPGSVFLTNVSTAIYFFLTSVVDRLLVYNMSVMNLGLCDYCYKEEEDLSVSRLRFFQISELSMRYPQVLRRLVRSNRSVVSLGLYIRREEAEILRTVEMMKKERESLESRMWFSVPQVSQPLDKPKALVVQKRIQFVKRIRSYNFVEILASRVVYLYRIRVLTNRYKGIGRSFFLVKSFMKFLEEYKDGYLPLRDLDEEFGDVMRHLHGEVSDAEKVIGRSLESGMFCR
ncbi:hypothetical protein [Encephalitozoon cuniculi GB-M1]|uniref:Uncharacterized protein n=1 Tax=Encephalitozoon cuniculi (strain GB-M1) TaxID=284813 RepID=Q8SVB4_ENCCU|nr:uncharacterized protein ECU06_0760 [Encephalitozoon cuniculi GB-M1]CAD25436.1 hypothetical protein [Encephalitozoon cuniculi GB-M1]